MWWKKTITQEEMGKQLWLLCCKWTDDFCSKLKPKFKAERFLRNAEEENGFEFEATMLHVWLISLALNEDQDRPIRDELHYRFAQLCADSQIQAYGEETIKKRFQLYYKAFSQDRELQSKGLTPTVLAKAAIKCLSPIADATETLDIILQVHFLNDATIKAVRNLRKEFRVR